MRVFEKAKHTARGLFSSHLSCASNEVIKKLTSMKPRCVSFDVFDTLLVRSIANPQDVFRLLENDLRRHYDSPFPFSEARIAAERITQKKIGKRQATLSEIYSLIFGLNDEQREWAMHKELELERLLCCISCDIQTVWNWCASENTPVIITSDTYLPIEFVGDLLQSFGYTGWKKLYVSSDIGHRKATGDLFAYVQQEIKREFGIDAQDICHIGDSITSDYRRPIESGMKAILIPRGKRTEYFNSKMSKWSNGNEAFEYSIINRFIAGHMPRNYGYFERIGYEALGPILYGFSKWLDDKAKNGDVKNAYFLTREGSLLKRAYDVYAGDFPSLNSILLYVSRRATSTPLLGSCESINELVQLSRIPRIGANIASALSTWGLEDHEVAFVGNKADLDLDVNVNDLDDDTKNKIFNIASPLIRAHSNEQAMAINMYLKEQGFNGELGVVDVGWFGTMQSNLQAIRPDTTITGYYVAKKLNYGGIARPEREHFYLYDSMYSPVGRIITSAVEVFELLFLSNEGTTIKYAVNSDGIAYPLCDMPEKRDENAAVIAALQAAALKFIEDFRPVASELQLELPANACSAAYCKFIASPTKQMLRNFSRFTVSDTGIGDRTLFATETLGHYITHPNDFISAFKGPGSKGLFLKNIFKIPLPWPHILSVMRRLEGQED